MSGQLFHLVAQRDPARIPLDTPHAALVAHARRMHAIHQHMPTDRTLATFTAALSLALDLRWHEPGDAFRWAWQRTVDDEPRHGSSLATVQWRVCRALAEDAPSYRPAIHSRCPGIGPRGGACPRRSGTVLAVLTNPETGEYSSGPVCDRHASTVRRRHPDDPQPAPNRGGALQAVFPEQPGICTIWDWATQALDRRRTRRDQRQAESDRQSLPDGSRPGLHVVGREAP